jgi:hypothetical protein
MTWQGWLQILIYLVVLTALTPLLGGYMARVYLGRRVVLERVLGPVERTFYRAVRTDPAREQDWKQYGRTVVAAAVGGRTAGFVSALSAALSYDFFLTTPYHSLRIDSIAQASRSPCCSAPASWPASPGEPAVGGRLKRTPKPPSSTCSTRSLARPPPAGTPTRSPPKASRRSWMPAGL